MEFRDRRICISYVVRGLTLSPSATLAQASSFSVLPSVWVPALKDWSITGRTNGCVSISGLLELAQPSGTVY